ncbi:MAG: glutathione S-transferase N-terminal domain-containing protein [Deltaproteobacteria bacterium]|nr:glutathione S-transferase N-terminal domain-containing protein [Deltaproteobacteria bacterium]
MLTLYYYDSCPFCRRVIRAIDELGIRGQLQYRNIHESREAASEIRHYQNGRSQVPMLLIGTVPMLESEDIIAYLRERFGQKAASH